MPAPTLVVGAPCWIDLYSSDTDKAKEFYGQLLGWTAEESAPEFGGYFTFLKDGKHVGGCMANDRTQGYPDAWTVYLTTDDADRPRTAAAANGGRSTSRRWTSPRTASAMVAGGAAIGVWQPGNMKGFDVRSEVGAASWFELHTRDYDERRVLPRRLRLGRPRDERRAGVPPRRSARATARSRGSTTPRRTSPRASLAPGRCTSRSRTSTPRSSGSPSRRQGRAAGRGHAVRPDGSGTDPTGGRFKLVTSPS